MSFRLVMMYLPDGLKKRPRVGGPSRTSEWSNVWRILYKGKVARLTIKPFQLEVLVAEHAERVLTVKKYANTDFIHITLKRQVYEGFERLAKDLGTTPEIILNNVLVWAVKKLVEFSSPK